MASKCVIQLCLILVQIVWSVQFYRVYSFLIFHQSFMIIFYCIIIKFPKWSHRHGCQVMLYYTMCWLLQINFSCFLRSQERAPKSHSSYWKQIQSPYFARSHGDLLWQLQLEWLQGLVNVKQVERLAITLVTHESSQLGTFVVNVSALLILGES